MRKSESLPGGCFLVAPAGRGWGGQELSGNIQMDSLNCDHVLSGSEQMARLLCIRGAGPPSARAGIVYRFHGYMNKVEFQSLGWTQRQEVKKAKSQVQGTQVSEKLKQVMLVYGVKV